jgi:NAD(P)H-hydrate epimerase
MELATAAQMKRMDETAIRERGIPSILLMERAARGILLQVLELAGVEPPAGRSKRLRQPESRGCPPAGEDCFPFRRSESGAAKKAAVFVGPGNNGGDGTAVAGLLRREGWQVRVFLAGKREKLTADHREMARRLEELGGALEDFDPASPEQTAFVMGADVVVDALFGVGLNAPLREPGASAVRLMNAAPAPVVAADLPSGIEADTGRVLGEAVEAAVTVTFSMAKAGLFVGKGALHAGRVAVHAIGIPADILAQEEFPVAAVTGDMVKGWLPPMPRDGHKGTFGRVYALAGSVGYTGAPVLATRAAARTGAGLVYLDVAEDIYPIVAPRCDEVMVRPMELPCRAGSLSMEVLDQVLDRVGRCDATLAGPGFYESPESAELVFALLEQAECPLVLDAGGLNLAAAHMDLVDARRAPLVLTPHDGEFARLGGDLSQGDRLGTARQFARDHGCVLVLKGHRTIVAHPDGRALVNTTGNPGMAKGGAGDVLSGMILALLGRGMDPFFAAAAAVYLHGLAGDLCAAELGEWGMLPTDLIQRIPRAFQTVLK